MSRDTIRFYEKKNLITINYKERRENNYKEYSDEVLERLNIIKRLKSFGFTLNEASEILDMIEVNEATCNNVSHKLLDKVGLLDEKIRELVKIRAMLLDGANRCKDGCSPEKPKDNCEFLVPESL